MRRASLLFLVLAMLGAGVLGFQPAGAEPGSWSAPFWEGQSGGATLPDTPDEAREAPPTAVSIAVMPDGKIVYWDGLAGLAKCRAPLAVDAGRCIKDSNTRLLDLTGVFPAWNTVTNSTGGTGDLFCADQRLLADGRLLAAGGTIWKNEYGDLSQTIPDGPGGPVELYGNKAGRAFSNGGWDDAGVGDMAKGRWYPTAITRANGKVLVSGGTPRLLYNSPAPLGANTEPGTGTNVVETETFDPAGNSFALNPPAANASMPLFSRQHLMPDGNVLYGGVGQMWSPFGQGYDQAAWNFHAVFDGTTWSQAGIGNFGARSGAVSVLLPLRPQNGYQAKVLVAGGTLGTSPGSYIATDITEIISYANGKTTTAIGPSLNNRRWYSSGVLLPTGEVIAFSGADSDEVIAPGPEQAVHQPELFDGDEWIPLATADTQRDRTYHNSAILLADGRILVGGHSPINYLYGDAGNNTGHDNGLSANNFKDYSFEIFTPPNIEGVTDADRPHFLQNGAAPTVAAIPNAMPLNDTFSIPLQPGSLIPDQVMLVRLPAQTHTTDADMRAVELAITGTPGTTVTVATPPSASIAPPGWYYLFLMKDGVPSKAAIVNVGSAATGFAVAPFGV